MSNKALVPLGLIAAAGVMGSLAGGQAARGRRGRQYDSAANEAWVSFFSADHPTPEGMRLGRKLRDRVEYLLDNKFNLPDDAEYPDLDTLTYLSYASLAGHGVGLWEADEPWHPAFEKIVMSDKQARDIGYRLDEEVWEGLVAAGEANRGRRARRSPSGQANYSRIKSILRDAAKDIDDGRLAAADAKIRSTLGAPIYASMNDIQTNLGSARMKLMRDWARKNR